MGTTSMGWPAPLANDAAWALLPEASEGQGAPLPSWARMLARDLPRGTAALLQLDRAQRTAGPVPAGLRAAARYVAARANHCDYAMRAALADAERAGVARSQLDGLTAGDHSAWSEDERAALRFALAMTVDSESYPDSEFADLARRLGDRQAAALVLHLAYANFQDRLLICLGAPLEDAAAAPPQIAFDWRSLAEPPTKPGAPPSDAGGSAPAAAHDDIVADPTPHTWLGYDELQRRLEAQRQRASRLTPPAWDTFAAQLPEGMFDRPSRIEWYRIVFGYAPELAVPFEVYMRAAGTEISRNWDRLFGNSLFWMVTDAMHCPYCMGHCEMNWEVGGLDAAAIERRSRALAGDDWSMFTPAEQRTLAFARTLTASPGKIAPADLHRLREDFGEQRALFLAVNASRYNYMTRISNGFQLRLESDNVFWDYYRLPAPTASTTTSIPRPTPVTRPEMKRLLEDMKSRQPRIPLPELTAEERAAAERDPRGGGYESRLRSLYLAGPDSSAYLGFSGRPPGAPGAPRSGRPTTPQDPALTLDYALKTRLFWIASRANNCQYCLGHQESKLLAVGMSDDQLAALDCDWSQFEPAEQAAFALARRLTLEPHLLTDADIDACRKHYTDLQILELVVSVAGNNSINRWKEGTGVPQSSNGGSFGGADAAAEHSYLTPTSPGFLDRATRVAAMASPDAPLAVAAPTRCERPSLSTEELEQALAAARHRRPRLPLVDVATARELLGELAPEGTPPQWMRLLANFPIAGKRQVAGMLAAERYSELSPAVRARMDEAIALQDRAWYLLGDARRRLVSLGQPLSPAEQSLVTLAAQLAASPVVLTDDDVSRALELAGNHAVVQAISYTTYRAAFVRITEAAGLTVRE